MKPLLTKIAKAMLRRVFVCGNAGYFHDELDGENWGGRLRSLTTLEKQGFLRRSQAKTPPRLLWHLTPSGAQIARELWCPDESSNQAAADPQSPPPQPPPPYDPTTLDYAQVRLAQARADYQAALLRAEAALSRAEALRARGNPHG